MEQETFTSTTHDLYYIEGPTGEEIGIPISYNPATDPFIKLKQKEDIVKFYRDHGYVVQRNLIPAELCDAVRSAFRKEVKPSKAFFYRQASGLAERHKLNDNNHMMNAVMNIQDLNQDTFGTFQNLGLKVLTHQNIRSVLALLIEGESVVAQTMYFEGNPVTWPHQDKEYLDSSKPGTMVAAWVAIEDIHPGAGRFYVYPDSHTIDIEKLGRNLNIILDRTEYIKLVIDTIKKNRLECVAPALKKGDVLFWHGKTIHGSLKTAQPDFSRSSFTAHYMPISHSLLQLQVRQKKMNLHEFDGMKVNYPKDQNILSNKLMFIAETTFPSIFKKLKSKALRLHKAK